MTAPLHAQFSPAWPRNRGPIRDAVRVALLGAKRVLEVASGPGQHAFDHADVLGAVGTVVVRPTDRDPAALASIEAWRTQRADERVLSPHRLDVDDEATWPTEAYDAVIAVNFLHMVGLDTVGRFFALAERVTGADGRVLVYDCFTYEGAHVSQSNVDFDARLRLRGGGVHAIEAVDELAAAAGYGKREVRWLPANNQAVLWCRGQ